MPDEGRPPTAVVRGQRREKLRSACDQCTTSKVRCNKERPSCSRCDRLDIDCIYGLSRRKGKPAISKSRATASQPYQSHMPMPAVAFEDQLSSHADGDSYFLMNLNLPNSSSHGIDMNGVLEPDLFGNFDLSAEIDTSISQKSFTDITEAQHGFGQVFGILPQTPSLFQTSSSPQHGHFDANQPLLLHPHPITSQRCFLRAVDTLSAVSRVISSYPVSFDAPESSIASTSMDQILAVARLGIQCLCSLSLCTCTLCTHDNTTRFVLMAIGAKVLDWFRAMYESDIRSSNYLSDTREPPSNYACTEHPATAALKSDESPACSTAPVTVGKLKVSQTTARRMKAFMLLCELEPLSQACKRFCDRSQLESQKQKIDVGCEKAGNQLKQDLTVLKRSLEALCVTEA